MNHGGSVRRALYTKGDNSLDRGTSRTNWGQKRLEPLFTHVILIQMVVIRLPEVLWEDRAAQQR